MGRSEKIKAFGIPGTDPKDNTYKEFVYRQYVEYMNKMRSRISRSSIKFYYNGQMVMTYIENKKESFYG